MHPQQPPHHLVIERRPERDNDALNAPLHACLWQAPAGLELTTVAYQRYSPAMAQVARLDENSANGQIFHLTFYSDAPQDFLENLTAAAHALANALRSDKAPVVRLAAMQNFIEDREA